MDDYEWSGSMSGGCSGASDSTWEAAYGVQARGSTSEAWNKIDQNGSNIWRFNFHFRERPENLVIDACSNDSDYNPEPHNFRFAVKIAKAEDESQISLITPEPDGGDDNSSNDEYELALDILSNIGGVYSSIGVAVGDYLISGSGGQTDVSQSNFNSKLTWDVE